MKGRAIVRAVDGAGVLVRFRNDDVARLPRPAMVLNVGDLVDIDADRVLRLIVDVRGEAPAREARGRR